MRPPCLRPLAVCDVPRKNHKLPTFDWPVLDTNFSVKRASIFATVTGFETVAAARHDPLNVGGRDMDRFDSFEVRKCAWLTIPPR